MSDQKSKPANGCLIALVALLVVTVGTTTFLFWSTIQAIVSPMDQVADAWSQALNEQVEVEGRTVKLKAKQVNELAVLERPSRIVIKYETTWLGSKKSIVVVGNFITKAGFDLNEGLEITFDENGQPISDIPQAKILSVEMTNYEIFHAEDGLINKLQVADQEKATNQLLKQARQEAENSDLIRKAEQLFYQRVDDLGGMEAQSPLPDYLL